jgi:hypothetical protein
LSLSKKNLLSGIKKDKRDEINSDLQSFHCQLEDFIAHGILFWLVLAGFYARLTVWLPDYVYLFRSGRNSGPSIFQALPSLSGEDYRIIVCPWHLHFTGETLPRVLPLYALSVIVMLKTRSILW